jgi:hypothetical protein
MHDLLVKRDPMIMVIIKLCKEIFNNGRFFYFAIKWIAVINWNVPILFNVCDYEILILRVIMKNTI